MTNRLINACIGFTGFFLLQIQKIGVNEIKIIVECVIGLSTIIFQFLNYKRSKNVKTGRKDDVNS